MGLLNNIKKYQLHELNAEQETLFTYFDLRYVLDNEDEANPYIEISLFTKSRNIEVAHLLIDFTGEEESRCYFCSSSHCEHLQIMVTKLLENEDIVRRIKEYDDYANDYEYRTQQKSFNDELEALFADIFNKDHSSMLHLAHLTPYFEDVRNMYVLDLKIGINKEYKINNLYQFLSRFRSGTTYQYGKELKIAHKLSNFDESSRQLINFLIDNENYYDHYFIFNNSSIDRICDFYQGQQIFIDNQPYLVAEECLKVNFHVDKDFHIKFLILEDGYRLFGENYYINKESHIIKKMVQDESLLYLLQTVNLYPLADIKSRIFDFQYTYFSQYPELFTFDEEISDFISKSPLKIEAYFDYDKQEDAIILNSKYFQEEAEISEFDVTGVVATRLLKRYQDIIASYGFIEDRLENSADIFNFVNSSLADIRSLADVYISDTLAKMNVTIFTSPSIRIERNGSLIDVFMEESVYSEEELKQIYAAIVRKKKYILIKDDFIDLSQPGSEAFSQIIENFEIFDNHKISYQKQLPLYYAFKSLNQQSNELEIDTLVEDTFNQVKNFAQNKINLPKINGKLRPYQKDGVKWLSVLYDNGLGGILADDMGLGKTIEAISFIKLKQIDAPILIVCPKSLIFNWQSEFKNFAPEIPTYAIHGTVLEREKIIKDISSTSFGVYFISYDSLRNEVDHLKDIHFDMCLLDEAQFIKNAFAKKTSAVKAINATHMFALTGTPIENNIIDLWSIFDFLMPGYLGDLRVFKNKYESNQDYQNIVKTLTSPFILRRRKEDVLKDLPDKYEIIYTVDMSKEQRKLYEAYRLQAQKMLKDSDKKAIEMLSAITRLRQICVDPSMFIENYHGGSGKLDYLYSLVDEKINDGHRILIFSQFVKALEDIEITLQNKGISYFMITGDTAAKDRLNICNQFNNNEDIKIVLISLKAGGTGLNLTGADTVIHIDPWWNIAAQNQASDRAHRIGQTRNVEVIKLISEDSIEQHVLNIQNEKKQLVELMISDNDESIKKLSVEELKNLLLI